MSNSDELEAFPEYKIVPIEQLIPYARNSKKHSEAQIAAVAASIREFRFLNPVIIDGQNGIVAGHCRVLAAQKLGLKQLPTVEAKHLTPAQRRAYVIADNKLAESEWDLDMLKIELTDLESEGFDLALTGFDDEFLNDLLTEYERTDGYTDPDYIPEPPTESTTKPGDVWIMGRHRLMCGDSTSVDAFAQLMDGARADFCFTSPPYNAALKTSQGDKRLGSGGLYRHGYGDDRTSEEYIDFNRQIFATLETVAAERFICCYNINYNKNSPSEYLDVAIAGRDVFPLAETIVWKKTIALSLPGDNFTRVYEFIFVFAKGGVKMNKGLREVERNLWEISNVGSQNEIHKACFPVELVEKGLELFAPDGGIVVEPFGGSGTTMIACEKTGRASRLMELDPRYCDVIVDRWQQFTGKKAVHESTGMRFDELSASRLSAGEPAHDGRYQSSADAI